MLFRSISSNAANFYTGGLKGRYEETKISDDHALGGDVYTVEEVQNGQIVQKQVPSLTALNARLRDDYTREIQAAVDRWNRVPDQLGIPFRITLPHQGFHRKIGNFAGQFVSPDGRVLSQDEWNRRSTDWLPTDGDHAFVGSLMGRVVEPGKFANWIAPPVRGIRGLPIEFEYVRFN